MESERRGADRCPVCQGPMRETEAGVLRCRKSICAYNFAEVACTRCQHKGPEVTGAREGKTQLKCPECMNAWSV